MFIPKSGEEQAPDDASAPVVAAPVYVGDTLSVEVGPPGAKTTIPSSIVPFSVVDRTSSDIRDFLGRPVVIQTITLVGSDSSLGYSWLKDYLQIPAVVRRLYGFKLIRFKAHLSFSFNPNPYQMGAMIVCSLPRPNCFGVANWATEYTLFNYPHALLDYGYPKVVELEIPWWFSTPYLDMTYLSNLDLLPDFRTGILSQLQSATGGVADNLVITVRIWLSDVELAAPSSCAPWGTSKVKKREENEGMISGPASAFAKVAGSLKDVPFIGQYAMASSMVANTVSSVAKIFGFSRPNKHAETVVVMDPGITPATTNGWVRAGQISWDNQCELTVDPRAVGAQGVDEMSLAAWHHRPGLLDLISVNVGAVAGTVLFNQPVTPMLAKMEGAATPYTVHPTNIAYATLPFSHWRGSLIYNFRVICSQFIKGRFRIQYEPSTTYVAGEPPGLLNTCVLDTNENSNVDVVVGWSSARMFREVGTMRKYITGATGTTYNLATDNGHLLLTIEAPPQAPNSTGTFTIMVSVRGGDDFQVAGANSEVDLNTYNASAARSQVRRCNISGISPGGDENLNKIVMGERVESIRAVIKRFSYVTGLKATYEIGSSAGAPSYTYAFYYRPLANYEAESNFIGSTDANRPVTSLFTWFMVGYQGVRGGVRWWLRPSATNQHVDITVGRGRFATPTTTLPPRPANGAGIASISGGLRWLSNCSTAGITVAVPDLPGVVVDFNSYDSTMFDEVYATIAVREAYNPNSALLVTVTGSGCMAPTTAAAFVDPDIHLYVAGAEDTSFIYLLGAPPLLWNF